MRVLDGCRFRTERLDVAPWHAALDTDELAEFVARLLTPVVTAGLPPDWQGRFDVARALRWIDERDAESTVLLVREPETEGPVGLLIVAAEDGRSERDLRIGYLLDEAHWGVGLAGELVGGFVEWCRRRGGVRSLSAGVDPLNTASDRVLAQHGFEAVGGDDDALMRRLSIVPDPQLTIRPETAADRESIHRVVASAFGSEAEADLVERIRASTHFVPELSLVAEVGGVVVGHVMVSGATVRRAAGERSIVMLSPLAVDPAHQRDGIGAALVLAAVDGAAARGEPLVVLEGDPAYYGRFGFEHAAPLGLVLPLPEWAPSEAGQVLRFDADAALDASLRGAVVYPPAFDGLE